MLTADHDLHMTTLHDVRDSIAPTFKDAQEYHDLCAEHYDRSNVRQHVDPLSTNAIFGLIEFEEGSRDAEYAIRAIRRLIGEGYKYLGHGTTRIVFSHDLRDDVAKVPRNEIGISQSVLEERLSATTGKKGFVPIADCWFDDNDLILWMERVRPAYALQAIPEWVWVVDCSQVGYDRTGKLVTYDL